VALAVEPHFGVRRRRVGVVRALLAVPLHLAVASGGSDDGSSLGLKLLCDAHAFNNVPSTEKCSLDM
jgi:hypothetical protein